MRRLKISMILFFVLLWLGMLSVFALNRFFLPERIYLREGEDFSYKNGFFTLDYPGGKSAEVSLTKSGSCNASLMLFDMIPLKTIRVERTDRLLLIPGGMAFGAKLFTDGVIVVGFGDVATRSGRVNPAKEAGLELGDIVLSADGRELTGNDDLAAAIESGKGRVITLACTRDGQRFTARLTPAQASDGSGFKAGMWVRDSSAGIGTITFMEPQSGLVAGLGHGITDTDTGIIVPVELGELTAVTITGVKKGQVGSPGELQGRFESARPLARLLYNCETGVYGQLLGAASGQSIPLGLSQDVKVGPAEVITSIDQSGPQSFSIEIESASLAGLSPTKNMVIVVTDPDLLAVTGGIVQGMSGSPIIQNGRLIGAVTHVFVNEPTRGYGIFVENMLDSAENMDNAA